MTNRAVTAMSVHATLEDLGYETCWKHGTEPYRWMGPLECPRCEALTNPNFIPRDYTPVGSPPPLMAIRESLRESGKNDSQKRGGRRASQAKKAALSDEQVIVLRDRYWTAGETLGRLAREVGVTTSTMSYAVKKEKAYRHIEYMPDTANRPTDKTTNVKRFTPDEVREIRRRNADGESYDLLGRYYDRTRETIRNICKKRTHRHV